MNPLETKRQILTWFCICPPADNVGPLQKFTYAIFSVTVVVAIASFRKYMAIDFEEAFDGLHPVFGWTPLVFIFFIMHFLKHRIVEVFDALSSIHSERKLKQR